MLNKTIKINWALLTLLTRGYVLTAVQAVAAAVAENSTGMQQAAEGEWYFVESKLMSARSLLFYTQQTLFVHVVLVMSLLITLHRQAGPCTIRCP
jgi:hypothetical protein